MRFPFKFVAWVGASALILGSVSGRSSLGRTQDEPKVEKSERGGLVAKSGPHQIEVFFHRTGLRVFPKTESGAAVAPAGLSGQATFYHPNSPESWFIRPIEAAGGASLDLAIGLDTVPAKGAKVVFEIAGLPGSDTPVEFTVPFSFTTGDGAPAASEPEPRYVYGPGAFGFGYYESPGPAAAPATRTAPAVQRFPTQGASGAARTTTKARDWSTGRSAPGGSLNGKPWLRPR